jgi:N-acetylneuraminate synthase/N,N'-diacetyllegionaminate synthase
MPDVAIGHTIIGPGHPCWIIAEAGVNHNGHLDEAYRLVDAAAQAGAHAVKFQTFTTEELVLPSAGKAAYQKAHTPANESQFEMLKRLELPADAFHQLAAYCKKRNICFLSSPFDAASADLLEELDVAAFKIGSGELTNAPLLQYVAGKGRPLVLSTGMATLDEVSQAVRWVQQAGNPSLILLHCVSCYPARPEEANLNAMQTLANTFPVPVGYSDHTPGIDVAIAAAARGACVLEKHLTLDRSQSGPDHEASLSPPQFRSLCSALHNVYEALGDGIKQPVEREYAVREAARRSLVSRHHLPQDHVLQEHDVVLRRPGTGIPADQLPDIIGRKLNRAVDANVLLTAEMLQ